MSGFAVGTFAGAISATAIYYSFSHSIQESTQTSRARYFSPPPGPLPAAARIPDRSFTSRIKQQWNDDIQSVVNNTRNFSVQVDPTVWQRLWDKVKSSPSS
ncbi:uncharacterized protein EI90DRAFT_3067345 [Cantharellus anzutake]|uniref:uncharacterized protein n=1 Tax=Cantharellus anzutake TaxID=1750568 RepID=UPI001907CC73|nr:uncharacterized protein EI90DRAFT_3067345 [Cantharellus anzutake]KAF8327596.1 hypothetical protein EI90DRAFT_3067345 [Cantharellus anzutake]